MWSLDNYYRVYKGLLSWRTKLPPLGQQCSSQLKAIEQYFDSPNRVSKLHEIFSADPDLCSLIINASNVDRYYGAEHSTTLEQALTKLTLLQLKELVILFAVRNLVLTETLPANHCIRNLWEETLKISSICLAINCRLGKQKDYPIEQSLLAGISFHIGTILLISSYRNKGLTVPTLSEIDSVPAPMASNISSLAAVQWRLPPSICECALQRNHYQEVNHQAFSLVDIFHMAVIHHRSHDKKIPNVVALKDSLPFIKAVKTKLINEEADHFTQMINGHALLIFRGLSPLINKFPVSTAILSDPIPYPRFGKA